MTPLALKIVRELTLPLRARGKTVHDPDGVALLLGDAHCFDFSGVPQLLADVRHVLPERAPLSDAVATLGVKAFLPADRTWIECKAADLTLGYLLVRCGGMADVYTAISDGTNSGAMKVGRIPIEDPNSVPSLVRDWSADKTAGDWSRIYAALAIINTPRMIGRKQHAPHRGLERELLRQQKVIGKFPLHAWTEITLEATPTYVDESGVEHEVHLTGRKCLHFCRAHLRVRNGGLEVVSAHWRGDPALGIKRSRYKIIASRKAA